jgi:valyl-tRNA synthetase
VVTPVDLIEEKGTDTVRYWTSTSKLGADTAFSEDALKIGKKLVNKLWNATKFAAIQLDHLDGKPSTAKTDMASGKINHPVDRWILTRLARAIDKASENFESYEYSNARAAVEDFFWNDLCDNYLEIAKSRAYDEEGQDPAGQQSACYAIYHCLETVLRLFAPFVPHITEELYSHIFDDRFAEIGSIHARGTWPKSYDYTIDSEAEQCGISTVEILNVVRKIKAEANVSIKWPIDQLIISAGENGEKSSIESAFGDLANVTSSKTIAWVEESGEFETDSKNFTVTAALAAEKDAA